MTFEEIMDYHPGNREVYQEIRNNISQMLPFVGSGLTVDFYKGWGAALAELGKYITDIEKNKKLFELLSRNEYLEAAQHLEESRGRNNLSRDLIHYYSREKLEDNFAELRKKAIYLLPPLFPCPVLTTNFDEGVEMVYHQWRGSDFRVLNPGSERLRNQARLFMNTPCLFKLHGSIDGEMTDYDTLVFTKNQYDYHYGADGVAKSALSDFVSGRSLLFLGCSLERDRTIDVLREQAKPGAINYAITSCAGKKTDERLRELDELGIRAIIYPDGQHTAVRIILEVLLKELHPAEYDKLDPCLSKLPSPYQNPYVYRSHMTPLIGRNRELDQLIQFVTGTQDAFRWWALTGPGGIGKSKLAMELADRISIKLGWKCVQLKDFRNLPDFFAGFTQSTLVVVDYVQAHARELGEQMELLAGEKRPHPLRLLLIERATPESNLNRKIQLHEFVQDGFYLKTICQQSESLSMSPLDEDLQKIISSFSEKLQQNSQSSRSAIRSEDNGLDWTEQLYENVHDSHFLKSMCWQPDFLSLSPLDDDALRKIISSFSEKLQQSGQCSRSVIRPEEQEEILKRLYTIDPDMRRPLYALFLAGAWMQGNNPVHWSKEEVLDYVIDRECKLLDERLRELRGSTKMNKAQYNACLSLYRLATALTGIDWKTISYSFVQMDHIKEAANDAGLGEPEELLAQLGLLRNNYLVPMEPDLVGEYFVYRWLVNKANKKQRNDFLAEVYKHPVFALIFFDRMFSDYAYMINRSPEQWEKLLPPYSVFVSAPDQVSAQMYTILAKYGIGYCDDIGQCQCIATRLNEVYSMFPDNRGIALNFAQGLVNLTSKDEMIARKAVDRLSELVKDSSSQMEIKVELAKGLFNLICLQDIEEAMETADYLKSLAAEAPINQEVVLVYAKGLVNLTFKQDENNAKKTVGCLSKLEVDWPNDQEIALALAKGVYNLILKQDEEGASKTVIHLIKVAEKWPGDREISLYLARGLVQVIGLQSMNNDIEMINTMNRLSTLVSDWLDDQEMRLALAQGLVNISYSPDVDGVKRIVKNLETLSNDWNEDPKLALEFAKVLVNYTSLQNKYDAEGTVNRLEKLLNKWPGDREITLALANGLVNLILKQDERDAVKTVKRLSKVTKGWEEDREYALVLAQGLVNLAIKQDEVGIMETVNRLNVLIKSWPRDRDLILALAKGLSFLAFKQNESDTKDTVEQLSRLVQIYPRDREINLALANGLVFLAIKQEYTNSKITVERLDTLSKRWPEDREITLELAKGLIVLLAQSNGKAFAKVTEDRLKVMSQSMPEIFVLARSVGVEL